jgi:hypothetical protein
MEEEIGLHPSGGAFHLKQGHEIVFEPPPGMDPDLLRVLLSGRMMAFLLRQRGWLPLHASAIEIQGQAVLFLGASGSGKSTTAAAFYSRGHEVIADDVSAVRVIGSGECQVRVAGPRIRLLDDSRAAFAGTRPKGIFQWRKSLFDLTRGKQQELAQVNRIYVLDFGCAISAERLTPMSAVAILSAHTFAKHWRMTEAALANHLRDCSATAGAVPVYRLFRTRSFAALPDLVRWVETDIESGR